MTRKLIAVGDLHGDFYRLVRILSEANALDPETLRWAPSAAACDVVLLGDYVDWRGEPLEGPRDEWPQGPRKVLDLILNLSDQQKELSRNPEFQGKFYPLCGNHDAMMLESFEILEKFFREDPGFVEQAGSLENLPELLLAAGRIEQEEVLKILTWHEQGGYRTIQSFGGVKNWRAALQGRLGDFLRNLRLAVLVNGKLFSHSVPDSAEYWIPLNDHPLFPPQEYAKLREQYLWGRKVWGYDAFAGVRTRPMTEKEIDEMLAKLKVKAVVVGHTALHQKGPYFHFGGKIVNLDTHGVPGSQALIEDYPVLPAALPALPRKRRSKKRKPSG